VETIIPHIMLLISGLVGLGAFNLFAKVAEKRYLGNANMKALITIPVGLAAFTVTAGFLYLLIILRQQF
jgi:hypothetical protein